MRKQIGNDRLTAQSYDNVGHIYFLTGEYEDAEVFWQQALALRNSIGDESGIILSLQNMGFLQFNQGQIDRSLKSFIEALEKSRSIKYENAIAVSLGNLGTIYQCQGRYDAAIDSYRDAVQILEALEDKKGIAEYTKEMASAYLDMHSLKLAKEKVDAAQALSSQIGSSDLDIDLQILNARLFRLQENNDQAKQQLNLAQTGSKTNHYDRGLTNARLELAMVESATGSVHESRRILESLRKETSVYRDVWVNLHTTYALALVDEKAKKYNESIQYCDRMIPVASKMGLIPYLMKLHALAGQAYLSQNQKNQAREHFTKANSYLEEIRNSTKGIHQQDLAAIPEVRWIQTGLKTVGQN